MAISVQEVLALTEGIFNIKTVRDIEEHIDQKLTDPQWKKDWICGSNSVTPFFRFVLPGHATIGDKKEVTRRYEEKGWVNVKVTNSEDGGERAGLIGITIGIPSKNKISSKVENLILNFIQVHAKTGVLSNEYSPRDTSEMVHRTIMVGGAELTKEDCQEIGKLFLAAGWNFVDFTYAFSTEHPEGYFDEMEVIKSSSTPK